MIEICRDNKELEIKKEYDRLADQNQENRLIFSLNIFHEARQLFLKSECKLITVVDDKFNELLYLTQNDDYYIENGEYYTIDTNFEGCNLIKERDNLDTTIIEKYDTFIFYELEEYTYAIATLLLECYPDKKVFFKDDFAKMFWENHEICMLDSIEIENNNLGRILNITSERKRNVTSVPLSLLNIQSSIFVMANLTWSRKRHSFGTKNEDKTIVIIDYPGSGGGMGDIVHNVQGYAQLIRKRGWVPVVRLTRDNQYLEKENDNMWEYYFENISDISLEEALQSKNVICGDENHFTWLPERILFDIDTKKNEDIPIRFNNETMQYFYKIMPCEFHQNKKILGIIVRGTDLNKVAGSVVDIHYFLNVCRQEFDKGYDFIFVATEDKNYHEIFYHEFGDKFLCIPQCRISYDYTNRKYAMVYQLFHFSAKERKEWGKKYLLITYCLSLCTSIITTLDCGCWRLSHQWRDRPYQFEKIVFTNKRIGTDEYKYKKTYQQLKVLLFLKENEFTIIYGTGQDALNLVPILNELKGKMIFCDKKARDKIYYFKGIEVIDPRQLMNKYTDSPILVSSTYYEDEIEEELMDIGIDKSRIHKLSLLIK